MFDSEISDLLRTGHPTDRIPYVCSQCYGTTYAPAGCVAVVCGRCKNIDLGTELARNRWQTVAEIKMANKPNVNPEPKRKLMHKADVMALALGVMALLEVLA